MKANDILLHVLKSLDSLGIKYLVVGSFSSNAYGRARSTQDADIVVELGGRSVAELGAALGAGFRMDPQSVIEFNTLTTRYIAQHVESLFKIEFFLLGDDPHDQTRFARRRRVEFLGENAWLPAPEDVVVWKLRWALRAGRPKDREDAFWVVATLRDSLDIEYMRGWCRQHGTLDLLEAMIAEVDEATAE
jgi:hypothetical protein